jgi:hypothetical protein
LRFRPACCAALIAGLLLGASPAHAAEGSGFDEGSGGGTGGEAPSAITDDGPRPPWQLTDEELLRDNWHFDAERGQAGSNTARLTALTVGSVVHGAGHFVMGEEATAWILLGSEIASIAVGLGGLALVEANPSTSWLHASGEALAVAGSAGFGLTWAGDLLGTLRGTGAPLPQNSSRSEGLSAEASYSTTVLQGDGVTVLGAKLPLRLRHLVATADFQAAPAGSYQLLGLYTAARIPIGKRGLTDIELGIALTDERLTDAGAGRLAAEPRLSLEADMGTIATHFANVLVRAHAGAEVSQLRFDPADRFGLSDEAFVWRLPVGGEASANFTRSVNIGLGYEQRDSRPVGRTGLGGYFTGRVGIPLQRKVGLELNVERGAGVRFGLALRWLPDAALPASAPPQ